MKIDVVCCSLCFCRSCLDVVDDDGHDVDGCETDGWVVVFVDIVVVDCIETIFPYDSGNGRNCRI